ncbi:MAG: hypothetical protein GEU76_12120 [Alphaproteobacteria bacterium]|nr:hypothetical protein [Alphaproteobacteria bacterium]
MDRISAWGAQGTNSGKSTLNSESVSKAVQLRSPKKGSEDSAVSRARWFRYYAGFSTGFVEDAIELLDLRAGSNLLDPWLGAGTTSEVAISKGYKVTGFDLNPAMLVVAKARLLPSDARKKIAHLLNDISRKFEFGDVKNIQWWSQRSHEPLEQWLQPTSAREFRDLEQTVYLILRRYDRCLTGPIWKHAGQVAPVTAFFYICLFRSLRHVISRYQASNPTWIKVSKGRHRIRVSRSTLLRRLRKDVEELSASIESETRDMPEIDPSKWRISQASSLNLPVRSNSINAVVSSPPYCTRIDYVKATLPELAVIDFPLGGPVRSLRDQMIGTPTIFGAIKRDHKFWGNTCTQFLSKVENHPTKASESYYLKYFLQYFWSASVSLREIDRALKKGGKCMLVIQDSYYKDIFNDLPKIYCEMAERIGWSIELKVDFPVRRTFAAINPDAKRHRNEFGAIESVMLFEKV